MDRIGRLERLARTEDARRRLFEFQILTLERLLRTMEEELRARHLGLATERLSDLELRSAALRRITRMEDELKTRRRSLDVLQCQWRRAKSRSETLMERAQELHRAGERKRDELNSAEASLLMNQDSGKQPVLISFKPWSR